MRWLRFKLVFQGFCSFLFVQSAMADGPIQLPAIIDSDLTLTSGQTYFINRDTTVLEGIELSMQPGAILKMCRRTTSARSVLTIRGRLRAEGLVDNVIRFASGDDDTIGQPVSCVESGIIEFDSTEISTVRHMEVSRGIFRLRGSSPVDFSDISFNPTADFDWTFTGPLAPNITAKNISFSSRVTRTGYFVSDFVAQPGDIMPNINMPYLISNNVEIPGNASLRVEAGVEVRMRGRFEVFGKLEVAGALSNNVIFSSPADNRHGTVVDAGFTGSFSGFSFNPQSHSSSIRHAILAITGSAFNVLFIDGSSPYFEDVLIDLLTRSSVSTAALIRVSQEGQPTLSCLGLRSTSTSAWSAILNENPVSSVSATEVYWDSPLGPTVPGGETLGARVWGDVDVDPHRTSLSGPCSLDPPFNRLLDVDGDGQVNPVIDGVLISRYMSGQRGEDLIQGLVISPGSARRSAAEIEAYLDWMITRSAR